MADDGAPVEDGTCSGCGARGVSGSQCMVCGAAVEPDDGSYHWGPDGWTDGPSPPPGSPMLPARAQDGGDGAAVGSTAAAV